MALALATGGADRASLVGLVGLLIELTGVAATVGPDFKASNTSALVELGIVVVGYAVVPAILSRRLGGLPRTPVWRAISPLRGAFPSTTWGYSGTIRNSTPRPRCTLSLRRE
jgi:hypothetical protein